MLDVALAFHHAGTLIQNHIAGWWIKCTWSLPTPPPHLDPLAFYVSKSLSESCLCVANRASSQNGLAIDKSSFSTPYIPNSIRNRNDSYVAGASPMEHSHKLTNSRTLRIMVYCWGHFTHLPEFMTMDLVCLADYPPVNGLAVCAVSWLNCFVIMQLDDGRLVLHWSGITDKMVSIKHPGRRWCAISDISSELNHMRYRFSQHGTF